MNASTDAIGTFDVYIQGQTTPLFTAVAYGTTSAQTQLPAGNYQLEIRPAGTSPTMSAAYTSPAITVTENGGVTAIAAGVLSSKVDSSAFRMTAFTDAFAAAAPGTTRIRIVQEAFTLGAVSLDLDDDGTTEVASVVAFGATDAAGLSVPAGHDLPLGVLRAGAHAFTFVVPGASLVDGGNTYVVLSGNSSKPPLDPLAPVAFAASGTGALVTILPNPLVYMLAASPDAAGLDGYIGSRKLFSNLAFGALGSASVPATPTGATLEVRAAGGATPLASLTTGSLDLGAQYLLVVNGLTNALLLDTYRYDFRDDNGISLPRVRVINAAVGANTLDLVRFALVDNSVVAINDFSALAAHQASSASGTAMVDANNAAVPLYFGARPTTTPSLLVRFARTHGAMSPSERFFGVIAGAWLPTTTQTPPELILVKAFNGSNPWSSEIVADLPASIAVTPATATLTVGATQQFSALGALGNGGTVDVTKAVGWSSQNGNVVTISTALATRGRATGAGLGSTTVTARLGAVDDGTAPTATASITVASGAGLSVTGAQPNDGTSAVDAAAPISVTFSQAIAPASLTTQTATGACTGTLQLSSNGFTTCVGFTTASPSMSAGNTVATATPSAALAAQTTYRVRVKSTVTSASGTPIGTDFTQATGFTTAAQVCPGVLVISQVYGGGNSGGGVFRNDFIELHNAGGTPVELDGYSLQASLVSSTSWNDQVLPSATIPPGGYFLVQEFGGGTAQAALPTPDAIPTAVVLNLNGLNSKVALSSSTTALDACPTAATNSALVDLVGYGAGAQMCSEAAAAPALTNSTAALRNADGCADTNVNSADFTVGTPTPRNSASPPHLCSCAVQSAALHRVAR